MRKNVLKKIENGKKKTIKAQCKKKQKGEMFVNRTLSIKTYPNHLQKGILKRWLGLTRRAYNTVVRWDKSRRRCDSSKHFEWIKSQTLNEKLKLYADVKEGKDPKEEDKKLRKSCVWGERKFLRTVVWLELHLKGLHDKVPANVIDESIDEALTARQNIIQKNSEEIKKSSLSFKSKKDLRQTITVRAQNFSKKDWNHFYITYLHNSSTLSSKRYKPTKLESGKRDLRPFHFETKRKHNKWPSQKIDSDCKLTYIRKTNEWIFHWVYEAQKQIRETQADVHVVSIDPGVRTRAPDNTKKGTMTKTGHVFIKFDHFFGPNLSKFWSN